jgi:hypothetical protein
VAQVIVGGGLRLTVASLALGLCGFAPVAWAQGNLWMQDGNPLCTATSGQTRPAICSDGAGGAFVAWEDNRDGSRIFLTHVTGSGVIATGWPMDGFGVSSLPPSGEYDQVLVPDGAGGVYVAWSDNRDPTGSASYVKRLSGDGTIVPGWPANGRIISGYFQTPRALLPDGADGVLVIVSEYFFVTDVIDLFAHHVLPGGTLDPSWPVAGRSLLGTQPHVHSAAAHADGSGGLFVAWTSGPFGASEARALHFDGSAIVDPSWPSSGLLLCSGAASGFALDGSGGGYVAVSGQHLSEVGLFVQRFTATGARASGWDSGGVAVCTAAGGQASVSMVPDGASGIIAAWDDYRDGFDDNNIYARRISSDGTSPAGWDAQGNKLSSAPHGQELKGLISDSQGGAIACWYDHRGQNTTQGDIYAQRIGPNGAPAPGWPMDGKELCTNASDQDLPVIATDGASGALVAWRDYRNNDDQDIYAARVGADAVTEVLAAVARTMVAPDHVQVVWRLAASPGASVSVERAVEGGPWQARATRVVDGSDEVTYEDREVAPAARYGYRLVVDGMGPLGEIWLRIPEATGFALRGFTPNPARGKLVASFTLPGAGSCRLELLDVSGRRVLARELGRLDPGAHRIELGPSRDLAPGVYLLLLQSEGRSASARACVVN